MRGWVHEGHGDDPRIPSAFAAGLAFLVTLAVAAVLADLRYQLSLSADLGIMSGLVIAAAWWVAWGGVLVTAGLAWLMLNSFVVSHDETLRWHGSGDLTRLVVLFGCAVSVATVRSLQLHFRRSEPGSLTELRVRRSHAPSMTGERHA